MQNNTSPLPNNSPNTNNVAGADSLEVKTNVNDIQNNNSPASNGATDEKMSMSPEFQSQQQAQQSQQQQQPQPQKQQNVSSQQQQQQQSKITFVISNFSQFDNQFYTSSQQCLGLTWKLYVFPKGNTSQNDLALFLDMTEIKQQNFPNQKVNFVLEMVNHKNPEDNIRKPAEHIFNIRCADWGFNKYMKLAQLLDPKLGFIVNDTITVNAYILNVIPEVITANGQRTFMYNSKKATGFVGLKNQGATCYMNSLLQALYQISPFRKAVYELPTSQSGEESIPLALQRLFYKLQFGSVAVSTKELTKSFGWGTHDIFTQHDVQELNRVLCDNLNEKMKGTSAEGTIDNLFRGKIKNFIKCEQVKYESKREEEFYDLSLNVKGCPNILQSFDKYTEVEKLDGNNKYFAEGHGLQVANKGCRFLSFPPVLHLQLKRFEYDPYRDANVKVNDRYTFPEVLDLTPYLDDDADKSIPSIFHLQGVLVHSGDLHNGHYYAFLKPTMDGEWLKFDDEDVSKCTFSQVTEESYGAEVDPLKMPFIRNFTNAYMLVYIRENESTDLLKPITDAEIPDHLKQRIESDDKKTNNQYFRIKLTTDEDFSNHQGFDLADFSKLQLQHIPLKPGETYNIAYLKRQILTLVGIPPERQRIWIWANRRNKTIRIDQTPEHDETTLAEIRDKFPQQEIKLYLEVSYVPRSLNMAEQTAYFQPIAPNISNVLIFFKYYDPQTTTMKIVGSKVIDLNWKASHLIPILNQLAGLPQNTSLILFEEISEQQIEPIKPSETLKRLEMVTGDIIVFQKPVSISGKYRYPTVIEYFDYIKQKTIVKFKQIDSEVNFKLELSKDMKYSQITNIISQQIKADASKIRLMTGPRYYGFDYTPIKPNENIPLIDILISGQVTTDNLFFEVLNIPVSECETKKNFKVTWQKPNFEYEKVSIWVPKSGDVSDIKKTFVNVIKETMPDIPAMDPEKLKLLELRLHKVDRELKDEFIAQIMDNINIKIEPISEEELNSSPTDKLVQVVHFSNETGHISYHGIPFHIVIKEEEKFTEIRARIKARFGSSVSANEFARWKLAIIQDESPNIIGDDTIVSKGSDWSNVMLGLLHNPGSSFKNQKAIKINK